MKQNLFNWRPAGNKASEIPVEHGAEVVTMTVITHCGGYSRPIDITPEVWWDVRCPEVPLLMTAIGGACINRDVRFWTTPAEYRVAVEALADYHEAPRFVPGIICCPFVFVRPVDRRPEVALYAASDMAAHRSVYEAEVVWGDGNTGAAPERWSGVNGCGPDRHLAPGYLDRGGFHDSAQPFRWCNLVEFFPAQVLDDMRTTAENVHDYALEKIAAYKCLAEPKGHV